MANAVIELILLAIAAMVISALKERGGADDGGVWPFYAKEPLIQQGQVLYHRLVSALPECIVLEQV